MKNLAQFVPFGSHLLCHSLERRELHLNETDVCEKKEAMKGTTNELPLNGKPDKLNEKLTRGIPICDKLNNT